MGPNTKGYNLVNGEWTGTEEYLDLVDPLNGGTMIKLPNTSMTEIKPFIESMATCPKTGLHNPFRNKERYLMYGEICRKLVESMQDKEVYNFFIRAI